MLVVTIFRITEKKKKESYCGVWNPFKIKRRLYLLSPSLISSFFQQWHSRQEEYNQSGEYRWSNSNPFESFDDIKWNSKNTPPYDYFAKIIGVTWHTPKTCNATWSIQQFVYVYIYIHVECLSHAYTAGINGQSAKEFRAVHKKKNEKCNVYRCELAMPFKRFFLLNCLWCLSMCVLAKALWYRY